MDNGAEIEKGKEGGSIFLNAEKAALSKVREKIDSHGTLFYVTTLDHLARILEHGIVSENQAKKMGIPYLMRWEGHSDPNHVYVGVNKVDKREDFNNLEKFALQLSDRFDQVAVIILDDRVRVLGAQGPWEAEILVGDRVSPEYFAGIAVGGSKEDIQEYMPTREMITSLAKNARLVMSLKGKAQGIMRRIFGKQIERYLPIYDLKGKLLWPVNPQRN